MIYSDGSVYLSHSLVEPGAVVQSEPGTVNMLSTLCPCENDVRA